MAVRNCGSGAEGDPIGDRGHCCQHDKALVVGVVLALHSVGLKDQVVPNPDGVKPILLRLSGAIEDLPEGSLVTKMR